MYGWLLFEAEVSKHFREEGTANAIRAVLTEAGQWNEVRDKMGEWMIGVEDQEALSTQLQDHDRHSGFLLISKYRDGCPFTSFVVDIDTNNGANIGV